MGVLFSKFTQSGGGAAIGFHQYLPFWMITLSSLWSTQTGRIQTSSFCVDFVKNSFTTAWSGVTAEYNSM